MRKLIVLTFLSLDGVMQAPGGPTEDPSGDFKFGGWAVPYFDEVLGNEMGDQMSKPFDLLLGRKTFEIFASYWPDHPEDGAGINAATKYVASTTLTEHSWEKTVFLKGDLKAEVEKLKEMDGPDIQVHGSASFLQTLLSYDVVDELWLKIFPVTLGKGKRLFETGTLPAAYSLVKSSVTPSGVIIASYKRAGDIVTGSF
ncbi:dihydrofolate reductase family protein [Candidatus Woesebacteria bacterium]|nr:dihydrofolate reductase family protein [Candidatus Woesebacteria bacterium]